MKAIQSKLNQNRNRAYRHFLTLRCLPLITVVACVGCKQEVQVATDTKSAVETATEVNPVGTYTLVSVDGKEVPCQLQHEGHSLTIKSGTFLINADGTCSSLVHFSLPSGGDTRREVKAHYTQEGPKLTMKWEGAGMTTGTIEGDNFTMLNEGIIFAYRK